VDAAVGDAPGPFVPIHLVEAALLSGAPDLVLTANPSTIDTAALTVNGDPSAFFVAQAGDVGKISYAVLFTKAFSVRGDVKITGGLPLIIVASDSVTVSASIDLSATGTSPGPGAGTMGKGHDGATILEQDSTRVSGGGGGGSYGSLGGTGGGPISPSGLPGVQYGMQPIDPLMGGSSGSGGAGGGALQISSAVSISISGAFIAANGGGGRGGSGSQNGGGGGGSGGEIFLEAPMITVSSLLVANGGGGGGGGTGGGPPGGGTPGSDGVVGDTQAAAGLGGAPQGSDGGAGAAGQMSNFVDAKNGSSINSKGGGGGGGVGRIWLRYRASTPPVIAGARFSPPAATDPTLP
jgi:hypothetical protein